MKPLRILAPLIFAAVAVASCAPKTQEAPTDVGVCWHVVYLKDDSLKFNKLASGQPNLETCAASLEGMRLRFGNLGGFGAQEEITGAYQGNYIFIKREGVFTSRSLTGGRYPALVRSGDGRLVIPGAIKQER